MLVAFLMLIGRVVLAVNRAARRVRAGRGVTGLRPHPPMGLPRPSGSPIALPATGCVAYLARGHVQCVRAQARGEIVRTHYFAPDGRAPPAKTQGCTAVSPRLLIRPPWPVAATRDENRACPAKLGSRAAEPV